MSTAGKLIEEFNRMVGGNGGQISLLSEEAELIRVGYRLGAAPDCSTGACILPHHELQELMAETLQRRDPALRVVVELLK